MERGLILLVAALVVFVTPSVQGTSHLSFSGVPVNITREGCGVTKLCVDSPNSCDPTVSGSCLFASVIARAPVAPAGSLVSIQLRGESTGYIAVGLSATAPAGTVTLFVCLQTNGSFFFSTIQRNNADNTFTPSERTTSNIRGLVTGNVIKCEFDIPNVNATRSRSSASTTSSVVIGSGPSIGTTPGAFSITLDSGPLDLANPASNVITTTAAPNTTTAAATTTTTAAPTTTATTTTAAPTTTTTNVTMANSGGAVQPHAVLLLLSVLSLLGLLRA